jgi:hypothetical protein
MIHSLGWYSEDGKTTIDYRPIHYYTLDADEMESVPPRAVTSFPAPIYFISDYPYPKKGGREHDLTAHG